MDVFLSVIALLIASLAMVAWLTRKKTPQGANKTRKAMSAGLFAMNEIFHPAAHESSIVIEEQREKRVAIPSPEDKENPGH